jgi:hypothetical protein
MNEILSKNLKGLGGWVLTNLFLMFSYIEKVFLNGVIMAEILFFPLTKILLLLLRALKYPGLTPIGLRRATSF